MIYFVTRNQGKLLEAKAILGDLEQRNIGYAEIQADTLDEVVTYGLVEVTRKLQAPVIIEDAGLFIDTLKGFPGVFSAYVFDSIGNEGILKLMEGVTDRTARFKSVVGYAEPGEDPQVFKGELEGTIGHEPRGSAGFGYDPIFYVKEKSLAEMTLQEKNCISHRAASMNALKRWLDSR